MKRRPRRRLAPSKNICILLLIIALFGVAIWMLYPIDSTRLGRKGMLLGLDLRGGTHLVYQADFPEGATPAEKAFDMERALYTIQRRVDKYGVIEPIIQKQGEDRILVQLPGVTDREEAKELIEQIAYLEFREVELKEESPATLGDYLDEEPAGFFDEGVEGTRIFVDENGVPIAFLSKDEEGNLIYQDEEGNLLNPEDLEEHGGALSWIPAIGEIDAEKKLLTGAYLTKDRPGQSGEIMPEIVVNIEWNKEGAELFDQIAKRLYPRPTNSVQRQLGIFLDNELISHPRIVVEAYHGKGEITGLANLEEASRLAIQLESGALPMPLEHPPLYDRTVSATLGADFIDRSILAGAIGVGLLLLFLILYYRLPGVLASLALLIYGAIVLAIFKLIPVTLTLPGIAGFILSIGMAVDANVLIFERLKEELRGGRTLKTAIETGFNRAWVAIRDSNVSTFIICGILYWFGSSIVESPPVMGFALTLFIGVAVSMFTAIVVTRTFLRLFATRWAAKRLSLFGIEIRRQHF